MHLYCWVLVIFVIEIWMPKMKETNGTMKSAQMCANSLNKIERQRARAKKDDIA